MAEIHFQKAWFIGETTCSVCLLYYEKRKPVKLHDDKALQSHLDGAVHRTAVNQLLVKHGAHAKIKAAALNAKKPKSVQLNLPNNNNNFWKYALLQQPTQLSAPSTSSSPPRAAAPTATTTSTATTNSRKRQRASAESAQAPPSSDVLSYTLLKQQQQLDEHSRQIADMHTILSKIDAKLSNPPASPSSAQIALASSALVLDDAEAVPHENEADNSDDDVQSGLDEQHIDDALSDSAASSAALQKAASAPAPATTRTQTNKRKCGARRHNAAHSSKKSRAHLRR
jgi:hypothetical protein